MNPKNSKDSAKRRYEDRIFEIMQEAHNNARQFFSELEICNAHPVVTGYAGYMPQIIMHLPPVRTAEPDQNLVLHAQNMLKQHDCDGAVIFYPVRIESNKDEDPVGHGVVVEVQAKGQASLKRILVLKDRVNGKNELTPPLPVLGKSFGVFYPNLVN